MMKGQKRTNPAGFPLAPPSSPCPAPPSPKRPRLASGQPWPAQQQPSVSEAFDLSLKLCVSGYYIQGMLSQFTHYLLPLLRAKADVIQSPSAVNVRHAVHLFLRWEWEKGKIPLLSSCPLPTLPYHGESYMTDHCGAGPHSPCGAEVGDLGKKEERKSLLPCPLIAFGRRGSCEGVVGPSTKKAEVENVLAFPTDTGSPRKELSEKCTQTDDASPDRKPTAEGDEIKEESEQTSELKTDLASSRQSQATTHTVDQQAGDSLAVRTPKNEDSTTAANPSSYPGSAEAQLKTDQSHIGHGGDGDGKPPQAAGIAGGGDTAKGLQGPVLHSGNLIQLTGGDLTNTPAGRDAVPPPHFQGGQPAQKMPVSRQSSYGGQDQSQARPWPGPPQATSTQEPSSPRQDNPDIPGPGPSSTIATSNTSPSFGGHQTPQACPRLRFIPPQICSSRGPKGGQFYRPGQLVRLGMNWPQFFRGVSPTAYTPVSGNGPVPGHVPPTYNGPLLNARPGQRICVVPPSQDPLSVRGPAPPAPTSLGRPRPGAPFPASPSSGTGRQTVRNLIQLTGPQAGHRQPATPHGHVAVTTTPVHGWGQGAVVCQPPPAGGMVVQGAACPGGNSTPRAVSSGQLGQGCAGTGRPTPGASLGSRQTMPMLSPNSGQATPLLSPTNGQLNSNAQAKQSHSNGQITPVLPTSNGQTTPMLSTSNGQTTPLLSTSNGQTTPMLPTSNGQTTPLLPSNNGQTTPMLPSSSGQTTPLLSTSSGQTTPMLSSNNGQTTPTLSYNTEQATRMLFQNCGQAISTCHNSGQAMLVLPHSSGRTIVGHKTEQATPLLSPHYGQATPLFHNNGQATPILSHSNGQATHAQSHNSWPPKSSLSHNNGQATPLLCHNSGQAAPLLPHNIGQVTPVLTSNNGQSTPASHSNGQATPVTQKSEQAVPHSHDNGQATLNPGNNGQATLNPGNNEQATPASDNNGEAISSFQSTGQATCVLQHGIKEAAPIQSHNNGRFSEDSIQGHPLTSFPLQHRQPAQGAGANRPCPSLAGQSGVAEQLDVVSGNKQQAGGVPHLKDSPAAADDDGEDVDRCNDESYSLREIPLRDSQPQAAAAVGRDALPPQGDISCMPGPRYSCSHGQEKTLSPSRPGGTEGERSSRNDQTETPGVHTPGDKEQTRVTKGEIQKIVGQLQMIVGTFYMDPTTKASPAEGSPDTPRRDRLQEGESVASEEDDVSCFSSARKGFHKSVSLQPYPSTGKHKQLKDRGRIAGKTSPTAWKHASTMTRRRRTKDTTVMTETRSTSAAQTQTDLVIHRSRSTPAAFPLLSCSQSSSVKPAHLQPSPPPSTVGLQIRSKSTLMTPRPSVNRRTMTDSPQVTDSSTCTEPVKRSETGTAMEKCQVKNTWTLTRCFKAVVSRGCQTSVPQVRETETMTEQSRLTAKTDSTTMTEVTERDKQTMTVAPTHTGLTDALALPSGQTPAPNQSGVSELHVQHQKETVGGCPAPLALPGTPQSEDGVAAGIGSVQDEGSEHCAYSPPDDGTVRITIRVRMGKGCQARLPAAASRRTAPPASLSS